MFEHMYEMDSTKNYVTQLHANQYQVLSDCLPDNEEEETIVYKVKLVDCDKERRKKRERKIKNNKNGHCKKCNHEINETSESAHY